MGKAARLYAEGRSFEKAFEATWKMYEDPDVGRQSREDILAKAI
jgi:hypothetical protein